MLIFIMYDSVSSCRFMVVLFNVYKSFKKVPSM